MQTSVADNPHISVSPVRDGPRIMDEYPVEGGRYVRIAECVAGVWMAQIIWMPDAKVSQ